MYAGIVKAIASLADDIDIEPGATVSKVLVKDGPVRLVLFALDEGEELTEHTSTLPVILQTVSGSITVSASVGAAGRGGEGCPPAGCAIGLGRGLECRSLHDTGGGPHALR